MKAVTITLLSTLIVASQAKLNTTEKDKGIDNSREGIIRGYLNSITKIRKAREPAKVVNNNDNVTEVKQTNAKVALVKKPIPKFTDTDSSEEDYQMKVSNPNKFSESVEHEDEDFNLDDYDFDVQHDEFAGRGKPLQPRVKVRLNSKIKENESIKTDLEEPKLQDEKVVPLKMSKSSKVTRKAQMVKEDAYDEEISTKTKALEKERKFTPVSGEDVSNESQESKEYEGRIAVRMARSPLSFSNYIDKLGEKTSALMAKILSYLPILPQIQPPKN